MCGLHSGSFACGGEEPGRWRMAAPPYGFFDCRDTGESDGAMSLSQALIVVPAEVKLLLVLSVT